MKKGGRASIARQRKMYEKQMWLKAFHLFVCNYKQEMCSEYDQNVVPV